MAIAVFDRPIHARAGRQTTRIPITVGATRADGADLSRVAEPVTLGLPFPRGLCADPQSLSLVDAGGAPCPVQARVLDRWPDGSIRWALVDFQADVADSLASRYEVVVDGRVSSHLRDEPSLVVAHDACGITVDTGAARFVLRPLGRFPFEAVAVNGTSVVDPPRSGLFVEAASGGTLTTVIERVELEEDGPLRSTVRCEGAVRESRGIEVLQLIARVHFHARSATVRVALTLRNRRPAGHPGGIWTLGGPGSVYLRDAALKMVSDTSDTSDTLVRCSPEVGTELVRCDTPFELYQDSSGGEQWQSTNHLNRDEVVPPQFRGYRVRAGGHERQGLRASPVVSHSSGNRTMAIAMPQFWQNFPKAIEAAPGELTLRLFPRQSTGAHELQGGEQKTHTFFIAFDRDRVTEMPLDWARSPLLARADPSWYCASGAVSYLVPLAADPDRNYAALAQSAVDGDDTFERKREAIDEYGWRHFGDVYADHEAVFAKEANQGVIISHYNNQYDAVGGLATRFLRSGDPRWWTLMDDLASHVVDIDTYRTDQDKAAYNHGLFWHTYHYIGAGTSSHRSYPKHPNVGGGGPSAEHNYAAGLLLHYFLTGDARSRETAIELAQWVCDMDDGRQTIFRWIDRGPTGLASMTGSPLYHGPGRGAANSINALLTGHRATGEERFLGYAETLIRRCIHPADDLVERDLLNAEIRWFYTVFLQAVGKYLDYKAELGAIDATYAYARASLLHYAAWMVHHEYPYLDRPEILEYPTETWAAQDMRKSDVFAFAAKHSDGEARARFLERADFFFHSSVSSLMSKPTRTLTRPVVLMLTNGFMHAGMPREARMPAAPPDAAARFGEPEQFVPQKIRALRRARIIAASASLTALAAALLYLFG
jgi:YetA-like protein